MWLSGRILVQNPSVRDLGHGSVVERLPSMYKALNRILSFPNYLNKSRVSFYMPESAVSLAAA